MAARGLFMLFACADIQGEKLNFEIAFNGRPSLHDLHVRIVEVFTAAMYECGERHPHFEVASLVFHDRSQDAWVDLRTPAQLSDEVQLYVFQPNHLDDMSRPLPRPLLPPSALAPHEETLQRSQTFVSQYRLPSAASTLHGAPMDERDDDAVRYVARRGVPQPASSGADRGATEHQVAARAPLRRAPTSLDISTSSIDRDETPIAQRGAQGPTRQLSSTARPAAQPQQQPQLRSLQRHRAQSWGTTTTSVSDATGGEESSVTGSTILTSRESTIAGREDALAAFRILDDDEDGIITLKALRDVMIYHGLDLSREAVADTFDYGDKRVTAVDFSGFGEAFPVTARRLRYMLERDGMPPPPRALAPAPPASRPPPLAGGPVSPGQHRSDLSPLRNSATHSAAATPRGAVVSPYPYAGGALPSTQQAPLPAASGLSTANLSSRPGGMVPSTPELDARELQLLRELEEIRRYRRSLGVEA